MENKRKAALAARSTELFIIARCDARAPLGSDEALSVKIEDDFPVGAAAPVAK
jgi:2-methylisocitrate lyase-like PEP mutase family enzyme